MQGAEIDCRDVIVSTRATSSEEEWTVIELRDRETTMTTEKAKHKTPRRSFIRNVVSPYKSWRGKGKENSGCFWEKNQNGGNKSSILMMPEISPLVPVKSETTRRKPFHALLQTRRRTRTHPFPGLKRKRRNLRRSGGGF